MSQPMDVSNDADASADVRPHPSARGRGRQQPATSTPSEIGRKRTIDCLHDVFVNPPKSRRSR